MLDDVRQRLRELQAYQDFEKKLREVQDPRDAKNLAQLQEIEDSLNRITVPSEFRSEWSNTEAGRRHSDNREDIKALREREQVSQPVFASYLNVRKDAVSKWERGEKRPDGPSLKLLNLVKAKGLRAIA